MSERPNIVFFMTDQLRRDALGCYGNTICQTPNLDRLAATGRRFDHAYTVSPVCSPARASIMTGTYPHNNGVMLNTHIAPAWNAGLSSDMPVFSRLLKESGYMLDYVGKFHVHKTDGPQAYGFDRFWNDGVRPQLLSESERHIEFANGVQQLVGAVDINHVDESSIGRRTQAGIEFIRERAQGDDPFFIRIDHTEPHFPCIPPQQFAALYDPADIGPWENFADDLRDKPACHLRKQQEWNLTGKTWEWWREIVALYYAVVSSIDHCVGQVVAALEDAGIADNTIFVFCTDHGDAMGSHGHFEKAGTMYDEIFRIPLLVSGPERLVKPGVEERFVRSLDLMPTFVDLGQGVMPEQIDGLSLGPLCRGENPEGWPDSVYCEHHGEVWGYHTQRMVRTRGWKYVYDPHDLDELYDLESDPAELVNRISDPSCSEVLDEMKARLIGWNDATGDMFQWLWVRWNFPEPRDPFTAEAGTRKG